MKLTDNLVRKVGSDKLLHFLIAGWLTQVGALINWETSLIIAILVITLNYFKEIKWDTKADMQDLYMAIAGSFLAFILQFLL